jgi:hypothetical protein
MTAAPAITSVELVRASSGTSLLRVDLGDGDGRRDDVTLVVRGVGLPRRVLPLPVPSTAGRARYAFGLSAELREGRFALALGEDEVPLDVPPERTREDALAAIELQRTRERLAALERELAGRPDAGDARGAGRDQTGRLQEQLAQHRLLRAQLARELEDVRRREQEVAVELEQAVRAREELEGELRTVREGSAAERAEFESALEAARSRVSYLERRLVEIRGRTTGSEPVADGGA